MALDCSGSFMKYMLFFFNFIFFICGAVILGVGIAVLVDPALADYAHLTIDAGSDTYKAAIILIICVGAFIFLVGFLGCCGACQESSCMLCLFAFLMTLVVLIQVVAAILAVVYKDKVESVIEDSLADQAHNDVGSDNSDPITRAFNRMQIELKCCGGRGPSDYGPMSKIYNDTNEAYNVPQSCCTELADSSTIKAPVAEDYAACSSAAVATPPGDAVHSKGCYTSFMDWVEKNAIVVAGVGFGLAVIEILGIIFACVVRGKINAE